MVDSPPPTGETLPEIAARYGRALNTLKTSWGRHPAWPKPIGKRGRYYVYDPAAVDHMVAEHFPGHARPNAELEPTRLYTAKEIETLTGVTAATLRADVNKGRWPAADDTTQRAHRWYGRTVMTAVSTRRGYTKPPQ